MNRQARFWAVFVFLILGNAGYAGYKLVSLKQPLTTVEMGFQLVILLVALALIDRELAKEVADRISKFALSWRGRGNTPPPADS